MTALTADGRKLVALAAIGGIAAAAILYAIWREASRPDYAADSAKYLKGVSTSSQTIDATVPSSSAFTPLVSVMEPTGLEQPRAGSPVDQQDPARPAISWSSPKPVFDLPEIQTPPEIKNLTGLDKIPNLSDLTPNTSFSMPALPPEPSGTTFRLLLPGSETTGTIGSATGLPGSIPGGVIGTAGGLLPKR